MASPTFDSTRNGYRNMWLSCRVKSGKDAVNTDFYAKKIIAAEARYRAVKVGSTPWYFIGALHMRESGCDFAGVLHNGEKIIGTGRKTKLVPAGRGPFSSWEEAAIDALRIKGFDKITEWSPERMGYKAEEFNGWGYTYKGVNSPYVWAGSNHEQTGKYIADHVWSSTFDDPQIGVMTVIRRLAEMRPDVAAELSGGVPAVPVLPEPSPAPVIPPPPDVEPVTPVEPQAPVVEEGWLVKLLRFLFTERQPA